jgi:hypothetical protein
VAAFLRFLEWSQTPEAPEDEGTVPTLDILMAWHAYMLDPAAYEEYLKSVPGCRIGSKASTGRQWKASLSQYYSSFDYKADSKPSLRG